MRFKKRLITSGVYAVAFIMTLGFAQATDGAKEPPLKVDDHSFNA